MSTLTVGLVIPTTCWAGNYILRFHTSKAIVKCEAIVKYGYHRLLGLFTALLLERYLYFVWARGYSKMGVHS